MNPAFSENALAILRERYLRRDEAGEIVETPDGMLERVARAVAAPARLFGDDADFWGRASSSACGGANFFLTPRP